MARRKDQQRNLQQRESYERSRTTTRLKESQCLVSRVCESRELVEEPLGQLGVHRDALIQDVKVVKVACVERGRDLGLKGSLDLLGEQ